MPKFIDYNYDQMKMLAVRYDKQILSGTFESSLMYLIDKKLDLTIFHGRCKNDDHGRPACDPAILLKIVLLAYSRGITSSRQIERLCRENVLFMAISADSQPDFTTLAEFISSSKREIAHLFGQVLMMCDSEGLIGKEMFAKVNEEKLWQHIRHVSAAPPVVNYGDDGRIVGRLYMAYLNIFHCVTFGT